MKGKWVWAVNMIYKKIKIEGTNSVYADKYMAILKMNRLNKDIKRIAPKSKQRAVIRRVMYFKDKVKENSFDDYCSICGGQLKTNMPLTETYKSSLDKP